jgi:hypothetical protein
LWRTGLFCGDTGLFYGHTVLLCGDRGFFCRHARLCKEKKDSVVKIALYVGDLELECLSLGASHVWRIGLLCVDRGLFCRDVALFCGDIGPCKKGKDTVVSARSWTHISVVGCESCRGVLLPPRFCLCAVTHSRECRDSFTCVP